ncbi:MAG: cyanophycin synthetase [Gemmatimonadales bacterium]
MAGVEPAIVGTDPTALAEGRRPAGDHGGDHSPRRPLAGLRHHRLHRQADAHRRGRPDRAAALASTGANAMPAWTRRRSSGSTSRPARSAISGSRGGRGELIMGGLTIINDSYNANPASFPAAIATARTMRAGRKLVFVAGTMRELGTEAARHHAAVAAALVGLELDVLAAVGDFVPQAARCSDAPGGAG